MGDETTSVWHSMAEAPPPETAPAPTGTKRDFANMLNQKIKPKKIVKRLNGTHWELPKKLKLDSI